MATTDIQYIKDSVERNHEENGWKESDFQARLDSGDNRNRIVAAYWRDRANAFITIVNTSESGSSRSNDVIYSRMEEKAAKFDAIADKEEAAAAGTTSQTLGSFDIERV